MSYRASFELDARLRHPTSYLIEWLSNDEKARNFAMRAAVKAIDTDTPVVTMTNWLKNFVESNMPEIKTSVYSSLLIWAIGMINYTEVSETLLKNAKRT